MPEVIMYATAECPYCERARALFAKRGVSFTEIRVDEQPAQREEMERLSGADSVPQIFVDGRGIGGFEDMIELDLDDELNPLLGVVDQD